MTINIYDFKEDLEKYLSITPLKKPIKPYSMSMKTMSCLPV